MEVADSVDCNNTKPHTHTHTRSEEQNWHVFTQFNWFMAQTYKSRVHCQAYFGLLCPRVSAGLCHQARSDLCGSEVPVGSCTPCWCTAARNAHAHRQLDALAPPGAGFSVTGLVDGVEGGRFALPGLPQSAHLSLPGLASTSCSCSLFPSASSAMVSLSVQPHRGGKKVPKNIRRWGPADRQTGHLPPPIRAVPEDKRAEREKETERSAPRALSASH